VRELTCGSSSAREVSHRLDPTALVCALRQSPTVDEERVLVDALASLLHLPDSGSATLNALLPVAPEGLRAPSAAVRALAASALASACRSDLLSHDAACSISLPLVHLLADDSSDASTAAHSAFVSLCHSTVALSALHSDTISALSSLCDARTSSSTIAARTLGTCVDACSSDPSSSPVSSALSGAHIFDFLPPLFTSPDLLAAMSALESFADAMEKRVISVSSHPELVHAARQVAADQSTEAMLRAKAVLACGRIIGSASAEDLNTRSDLQHCLQDIAAAACSGDSSLSDASFDAIYSACQNPPGAYAILNFNNQELLQRCCSCAFQQGQLNAIYALVALANRAPNDFDDVIRDAIFCTTSSPANMLWSLLKQRGETAEDGRRLSYSLIINFSGKRWFAQELSSHSDLMRSICSSEWEQNQEMCEHRHEAVKALANTITHSEQLQRAVNEGPYGISGSEHRQAAVDVADRRDE